MSFPDILVRLARGVSGGLSGTPDSALVSEQRQDRLRRLIGDREGLRRQLLLHLKCLQPGGGLFHIGIDQGADARLHRVRHLADELVWSPIRRADAPSAAAPSTAV